MSLTNIFPNSGPYMTILNGPYSVTFFWARGLCLSSISGGNVGFQVYA